MGSAASKTSRTLKPTQHNAKIIHHLKKQIPNDHLQSSKADINQSGHPQVFTERPPLELEKMGDADLSADELNSQKYDENHESVRVLKNRQKVEEQYKGLFIPKDADQPNIPERFLNEQQKKEMRDKEFMKKKLEKSGVNSFGLFDSGELSDLIADYKVYGEAEFVNSSRKTGASEENIEKFKELVDSGILTLPSHKVTLNESIDSESKQIKQKLIVVADDWVKTIKENLKKEAADGPKDMKTTSKKDEEVLKQFKMLEQLVSKSQVTTRPKDSMTEETETVLKRPKKQIVKEFTTML
ncbi:hypothetical protein CAS74_001969 [Pichia kudriavzevii]|uniref:Uncharacterized protein n=1 Tax=Pichia kudriavzevii TaxID=4909 RepID=A0A1Z8JSS0_PICKU|nr:hypothetical protein CAS74_001969 [Pichia kudriavzevii]